MNPPPPDRGLLARLGRALHRLVHPQHLEERARLERLAALVTSSAAQQAKRLEAMGEQIEGLAKQVGRAASATDLRALSRDVERLAPQIDALREDTRMRVRSLSQTVKSSEHARELQDDETRVLRRLMRLAATDRPVLVGPWSGEVGFELLYWIPFVTWALQRARVKPERLIVVSRGGPAAWYAHLGGRYFDALSCVSPAEFRVGTEAHKKQRRPGAFDRLLVRRAMESCGGGRPILLHPGLMYRLFYPYWKQAATMKRVAKFTQPRRITVTPSSGALAARLPREYVAVRFYFSSSFPDTTENRAFITATIGALAASTDVVVLNTPFQVDDHSDAAALRSPRVRVVDDLMAPESNLDLQTTVIGGARAFVGTYGGYAYLAPLCGVPSVSFYSVRDAFFAHHLELAEQVFRDLGAGSLVPIDVRDAALIQATLAPPRS